jgi:formylglycine-generating enzyme required for sulfatase activity
MKRWMILVLTLLLLAACNGSTAVAPAPGGPPACTAIGQTWTRPADGMVMVCVPAGEFLMGSADADRRAYIGEKPQHTVYLDAFWIDSTPVTNAHYRRCLKAGACTQTHFWNDSRYNAAVQPVLVTHPAQAEAYATWAGARLPTEAEWEKAARGTDGRVYPWGGTFDPARLNYCDLNCEYDWQDAAGDDGHTWTSPVGAYPAGASPYGALDMAGNVWQWVADWFEEDYYARAPNRNPPGPEAGDRRVLRGGSFIATQWNVRCACRHWNLPGQFPLDAGFRCAVEPAGPSP